MSGSAGPAAPEEGFERMLDLVESVTGFVEQRAREPAGTRV